MTHYRIDTLVPNDDRRLAATLRCMEMEDLIINSIDMNCSKNILLNCAMYEYAYRRAVSIIKHSREPIFGYPLTQNSRLLFDRCQKLKIDSETRNDAALLVKNLDAMRWTHGFATFDEVVVSIGAAVRYIFFRTKIC